MLQKQKPPVAGGDDENKQGDDDVLMLDLGLGDEEDWLDVDDDDGMWMVGCTGDQYQVVRTLSHGTQIIWRA